MKSNFLMDNWCTSGNGITDFAEAIHNLAEHTKVISVLTDTKDLDGVYSITDYKDGIISTTKSVLNGSNYNLKGISNNKEIDVETFMKEMLYTSKLMFRFFNASYFVSEKSYFTLSQKLGMDDCINFPSLERDIFISHIMQKKKDTWKICVREMGEGKGKVMKIFAAFSDKYVYIPQTVILDILKRLSDNDVLGRGKCKDWFINHDLTEVVLQFDEKADEIRKSYSKELDIIPALRIVTSDIGKSSFIVQAIWKKSTSGAYVVQDEISLRHTTKNIFSNKIIETVEEKLFPVFSKLPERLLDLMEMDVTNPLYSERRNKEAVIKFVNEIFKKTGMTKIVGKQNEMKIKELLLSEIDFEDAYTAYDIVVSFMDLPARIEGLAKSLKKPLEKICGKAPFVKFDMESKKEEDPELFLKA